MKSVLCIVAAVCATVGVYFFIENNSAAKAERVTIESKPIDLISHGHIVGHDSSTDEGHHVNTFSDPYIVPEDMWVTGIEVSLAGAPAVTLHHATLFRGDSMDRQCPQIQGERIVSVSQDQMHDPTGVFPAGYGIFLPKETPLLLHAMFHNPQPPLGPGGEYIHTKVQITLHISKDAALKPISFDLLRLAHTPCANESIDAGHVFTVPPHTDDFVYRGAGSAQDTSKIIITSTSTIVYWGAHIHGWEGGKALRVLKNGELLETFSATKSKKDRYRYDTPHMPTHLPLFPGDVISIEALYSNPTDEPLRGAMGELGIYIAEE